MNKLLEHFKPSDTKFGVFYPKHHLIAIFPNGPEAERTLSLLRMAGFREEDVAAGAGEEIIELEQMQNGLGSVIMQTLSRIFATEQKFTDQDVRHAREGAGFLAAHCPTEQIKNHAWEIIREQAPLDARYYSAGGIEHLAGDFKTD